MTASVGIAHSWKWNATMAEIAQDNVNELGTSKRRPAAGKRRDSDHARMRKKNHEEKSKRDEKTPVEIFSCLKRVSPCRDRGERQVRGALRKRTPLRTQLALTLGIDRYRAEKCENEECREENDRGVI